ncbi:MAG: hypothetical protein GZ089_12745 [Aromatoleum sp.]|nr:hypothetical protein [Aromatoleum sp.]
MILSRRHRFVFVKGMKVAGTSVEIALSAICGPDDIVTPMSPVDEKLRVDAGHPPRNFAVELATEQEYVARIRQTERERLHEIEMPRTALRFWNHMPLAEVERRLESSLDAYKVICVERSPYEKAISLAHWMLNAPEYRQGQPLSFDVEKTRLALDQLIRDGAILQCRNIDRYRRANGELAVDALRFDALADDFAGLIKRLGVPGPPPALPHVKSGNYRARPIDVLSMRHIAAINELFAEEFAFFRHPKL